MFDNYEIKRYKEDKVKNMEERFKSKIVVDLLLSRKNENNDDEILLSLRKNTGHDDGKYELPGGHVEEGEDLIEAIIREAKEELKINLKRENLKIAHILHHYKGKTLKFILTSNNYEETPTIGEPDKCEELRWFDINNLPKNVIEKVRKTIIEIYNNIFYDNSDFINFPK